MEPDPHPAKEVGSLPASGLDSPEFLSRFAHELRTPLQVIMGYSELLGRESLAPESKEAVEAIQVASSLLLELVKDSLDLGVSESGKTMLRLEAVDCFALVAEVERLIIPVAARKSIALTCDRPSAFVLGDHRRLVQILLNLLTNAVKFTPEGGRILLRCFRTWGGRIRFEVRDSGPGIPNEALSRIFRPFERLAPDVPGAGLGLAICRSLVQEMDGTIGTTSLGAAGSTFWFEVPGAKPGFVDDACGPSGRVDGRLAG